MTSLPTPARLAAALAACVLAPAAVARADVQWSAAPAPVAEGAPGSEPETGRRTTSALAAATDGTGWFAFVQTDDATNTITPAAEGVLRVSRRAPGGTWAPPTDLVTVQRAAGSNWERINDVDVAVDGAGRPTVAWQTRTQTTATVWVRSLQGDGTWSTATALGTTPATSSVNTTIELEVAPDGAASVGWQATDAVVLAVRPAGGDWGTTPETVSAFTTDVLDTVGVGRDQDGAITVVYRGGAANASRTILTRTRSANGTWGTEQTLTSAAGFASRPGVVVDLAGSALATWGSADGPRAAHRAAGSATFGAPEALVTGSASAAPTSESNLTAGKGIPSATVDAHGTATVAFVDGGTAEVKVRSVTPTGTWTAAETVATGTPQLLPAWPRVTAGPDGRLTVVWTPLAAIISNPPPVLGGAEVKTSTRPAAGAAWTAPQTFTTPSNGSFGSVSALGYETSANLSVAGDALGNVALGWSPYASSVAPGVRENQSVDGTAPVAARLDWTARGIAASNSLRSWASYLSSNWPSVGPCIRGAAGVEVSGAAAQPSATDTRSWRLTQTDAYRHPDGRVIVQYAGTIRWVNTAHCIDNRVIDPRLEIAADGTTARISTDGQASGSMADAMAGTAKPVAISNVRLLNMDLGAARVSGDGSVRSWIGVPATLAGAAGTAYGMETYTNRPFGRLTFSVPTALETRTGPKAVDGGGGGSTPPSAAPPVAPLVPGAPPLPGTPAAPPSAPTTTVPSRTTATIKGAKTGRRTVTLTLARTLGTSATRTYRIRLTTRGRTVATGTLKGRTLRLTVRSTTKKGAKKARYPRLKGSYALRGTGLRTTTVTVR